MFYSTQALLDPKRGRENSRLEPPKTQSWLWDGDLQLLNARGGAPRPGLRLGSGSQRSPCAVPDPKFLPRRSRRGRVLRKGSCCCSSPAPPSLPHPKALRGSPLAVLPPRMDSLPLPLALSTLRQERVNGSHPRLCSSSGWKGLMEVTPLFVSLHVCPGLISIEEGEIWNISHTPMAKTGSG